MVTRVSIMFNSFSWLMHVGNSPFLWRHLSVHECLYLFDECDPAGLPILPHS